MNVTTLTIVMAAYSNGRVAAIVISVLYRMLTEKVRYGYASEAFRLVYDEYGFTKFYFAKPYHSKHLQLFLSAKSISMVKAYSLLFEFSTNITTTILHQIC